MPKSGNRVAAKSPPAPAAKRLAKKPVAKAAAKKKPDAKDAAKKTVPKKPVTKRK